MQSTRARLITAAVTAAAAVAALIFTITPAAATDDRTVCGYAAYDPETDGLDVDRFLSDGQGRNNQSLLDALNLGSEWCGSLKWLTDMGASIVVDKTWQEALRIEIPWRFDFYLAGTDAVADEIRSGQMPSRIPAVGPSTVGGRVFGTDGQGLLTHPDLSSATNGLLAEGTKMEIICQSTWVPVEGPYGTTSLWDKVVHGGRAYFVSDAFVFTGSSGRVAPEC